MVAVLFCHGSPVLTHVEHFGVDADPVEVAREFAGDVSLAARGQTNHHDDAWCDRHVGDVRT